MAKRLRGDDERERIELTGLLDLTDEIETRRIRPRRNQRIEYKAVFRRTRVPREIDLPYGVKYESLGSKVRLEIIPNTTVVKQRDDTYTIKLTFTGSRADLDKVEEGVKDRTIRAYVRAEDSEDYRNGKEGGGGYISSVRLEMPDDLRRSISFEQPGRNILQYSTVGTAPR